MTDGGLRSLALRIGFVEPHLRRYGGIRRVVEFANRLVDRGCDVTFFLPPGERTRCTWMPCRADVQRLEEGFDQPLDVVIFNEESQWHCARLFRGAARTVFYALHYAQLYEKPGSWEALRLPVDLRLANSTWTADMIEADIGERPHVLLGGVNPDHFRPLTVPKRYPLLCVGDRREWKGTDTIREAADLLGLPVEMYAPKNLSQRKMAAEYGSAEVFVVGSHFEGFGQPGLEALACGTPLVTTDNGGCREYAIHDETALVVPPGDATAMAAAIGRLRQDPELAGYLTTNGLTLVAERFDWDRRTDDLAALLQRAVERPPRTTKIPTKLRRSEPEPLLSVVVLAWDQLFHTQRCVQSVRQHTDVPYELILVDNGSQMLARAYAEQAGDVAILNSANLGFAPAMNQGLANARGKYVAFLNNDTKLPSGWASAIIETLERNPRAAIVVPALTAAGNDRTVRQESGTKVELIEPFGPPPSAVLYVMPTQLACELGGWDERFEVASAEDIDLCFRVWVNSREVLYDQRVLVEHAGKGTAGIKLPDYRDRWDRNRRVLLEKWTAEQLSVPRIDGCPAVEHERNVMVARSVARWMQLEHEVRTLRVEPGIQAWVARRMMPVKSSIAGYVRRNQDRPHVRRALDYVRARPRLRRYLRTLG